MKSVEGISFEKKLDFAICHISDLTEEIKLLLRDRLSFICYGCSSSQSDIELYNYENTLKEFILRYENKSPETKKGMIGELLSHLIIGEFFSEYIIASPFFNKEERSIKKGFDVVLSSKTDHSIWITEVKSGELHDNSNADRTSNDLLGSAKNDLISRLNSENRALWLNAINDAKIAYEKYTDLKDSIVKILSEYGTKAGTINSYRSADMNVFLVSALFAPLSDSITSASIETKFHEIKAEDAFKKLFIMSIQKGTYNKVFEFLQQESVI